MYTNIKISLGLFILLLTICESSFSQDFGWKSYSEEEGLPHGQVSTIFQSEDGFIWVGTYVGGLGRYSSSGWKYIRSSDNLPSNWITCVTQNVKTSQYFFGTIAGVVSYKNKIENISRGTILENQNITALYTLNETELLVGTLTGLYKFNLNEKKLDKISGLWVTSIKYLDQQKVLIADKSGLFVYNNDKLKIEKSPFDSRSILPADDIYGNFYITSIYCENPNHIWIGTSFNRLFEFNNGKVVEYVVSKPMNIINKINDICKDRDGFLWIATDRGLFYILNDFIHSVKNNNLNNIFISSLMLDYENNMWVGTNNGLWKSTSKAFLSFGEGINSKDNNCYQILEKDHNEYLVGTLKGLLQLKFNNSVFEKPECKLYQPSSRGGLDFIEFKFLSMTNQDKKILANDRISSTNYLLSENSLLPYHKYDGTQIFQDPKSNIWTYSRNLGAVLIHSEKRTDTIFLEKEKKIELYSIVFFDNEAFICTINGIYIVSENKIKQHITVSNGLSSNSVQNLLVDKFGNYWCATENGLNIFDKLSNKWYTLNTSSGFSDNFIYWLFEDRRKSIWIGTPQGVNRIDRIDDFLNDLRSGKKNFDKYLKKYSTSEGLGALDCNQNGFLVDSKGRIWISTIDHINLYLEQYDLHQPVAPKVAFSKIEINSKEADISDFNKLSAGAEMITFYFAGNTFIDESFVKYRYYLEGYDKDYSEPTGLAFAQYHNVPPGKYVFHLKAISKNGLESIKEANISFEIKALFYQTIYFKITGILASILVIVYLSVNFQKKKTKRKFERLERETEYSEQKRKLAEITLEHERDRMEKERLQAEMKLKRDFTAMLIHELRSPLSSINGYAKLLKEIGELNVDQSSATELILKLDERMLNIVNQMLDLSKFEAGKMEIEKLNVDIIELINETTGSLLPLIRAKNISFIKKYHVEICPVDLDIMKIMQVLTNIISNAIKFSPENGTITISTSTYNNMICVSCSDDGPGINKEEIGAVFDLYKQVNKGVKGTGLGLSISKLIVEAHNGKIFCESEKGKGATFTFCLPLN
jgi:signal transduction histidine kinase